MGGLSYGLSGYFDQGKRAFLERCTKCFLVSLTLSQGCQPDMIYIMNLANVNCRQIAARMAWWYGQDPLEGPRGGNFLRRESAITASRLGCFELGISV